MSDRETRKSYSIDEVVRLTGMPRDVIRRAIHATNGPALKAVRPPGRDGKPGRKFYILAHDLDDWLSNLDDA